MKILGKQVCPFSVIHSQKVKISILMKAFQRTDVLRKMRYFFTCSFLLYVEESLGYKLKSILPSVVGSQLLSSNEVLGVFLNFFFPWPHGLTLGE